MTARAVICENASDSVCSRASDSLHLLQSTFVSEYVHMSVSVCVYIYIYVCHYLCFSTRPTMFGGVFELNVMVSTTSEICLYVHHVFAILVPLRLTTRRFVSTASFGTSVAKFYTWHKIMNQIETAKDGEGGAKKLSLHAGQVS